MFAHIISTRQSATYQGTPTYLSIAVGVTLSCFALSAQAASSNPSVEPLLINADQIDAESPQFIYERLSNPNMPIDGTKIASKAFVAAQARLFFECTQVQTSAARLACFDKVAEQGKTPSYTNTKQPLDLAKTFKSTISGNPQVIFVEEKSTIVADDNNIFTGLDANQSATTESLDTIGLTQRESQVLENVGVTQSDIEKYSPLSLAYDLDQNSERGTWTIRPHNPNYVLPLFYTADPNLSPSTPSQDEVKFTSNNIREAELKFQLSLKSKVAEDLFDTNADLWFGYTQQSHWQVYNEDNSRPFRATDYQPEVFLTQPVTANLPFGGRLRMLGVGAVHHSNGRSEPLSRSWNRVYLMGGAEWGKFSIVPRVWARVDGGGSDDDNPDIEDFMGYGDIKFLYDLPDQKSISGTLRYNTKTDKGAAQIDYVFPLTESVNGYVQLFQGYGESLIDYNYETTAIGVGIVLNDWKGF
ncbi:phospholipase A [Psychrobacter sp. CAL346-MNA-CIBAN-0220]|uniref:phospholipase A n=1 Tax=Psychrobacter sp. CAL346-MNA-CIBAN-0220 TaxID=3140457 RepID=UPI00331F7A2C